VVAQRVEKFPELHRAQDLIAQAGRALPVRRQAMWVERCRPVLLIARARLRCAHPFRASA